MSATGGRSPESHGGRPALLAFIAALVLSWWLLVYQLGARRWFFRDDWLFLAGRDGGSLEDVFRPHDVHPGAVPVLIFRAMFHAFGLWFTPYLVLIVTLHLAVVVLLRVIMRRAGVGPWIASAAAGAFFLFGPGEENILWAFQINYVLALLLGLAQLMLADHGGGHRRRDVLAVLAGVAGVMCSGIGPVMVMCVGVAMLTRRGWRAAAVQTAPAVAAYGVWVVVANPARYPFGRPSVATQWDWIREGMWATLEALGRYRPVAALLVVVVVVGAAVLWRTTSPSDARRRFAVPAALAAGTPLLFVLTAQGRWPFGVDHARSSRYVYVAVVLLLPALAVAADAIARRWRGAGVLVVAVLLVAVPANAAAFNSGVFDGRYFDGQRQVVLGLPRTPEADQAPPWVAPVPEAYNIRGLTIGWLVDLREAGRLPEVGRVDPGVAARFPIHLGLAQVDEPVDGDLDCARFERLDLSLARGDRLGLRGSVNVRLVSEGKATSPPLGFSAANGETLTVVSAELDVRFLPAPPNRRFQLCV